MKENKITLKDGDGLEILKETKEFKFGCCDCGLVHNITVERKKDNIILRFFRVKSKKKKHYVSDCCATDKKQNKKICSSCGEHCKWIDIS